MGLEIPISVLAQVKKAASVTQRFWHVTLPMLRPIIIVATATRIIWTFNYADLIFVMTNGGPANATQSIAIYAYQTAYRSYDFGRGSALGYLIALAIMVLAAIYLRLLGRVGRS